MHPALLAKVLALVLAFLAYVDARASGQPQGDGVASDGLQLEEVLESSRRYAPAILEAIAMTRAADGRLLASEGAFDLLFSGEGFSRVTGYYDGIYLQGKAVQPLSGNGGQIEASYRVSRGDFPVYEDFSFTDQLGELKVRGVYALLRDRKIDERRFGLRMAEIDRDMAGLDALIVAIGVQQRAIQTYGQWVATGQQVRIYRDLLRLAEDRTAGIRRQIAVGARAVIMLTENEQNLLRRKALLVAAERDLANAAQRLSMFWRDADGRPRVPGTGDLPATLRGLSTPQSLEHATILGRRPDLHLIERRLSKAALSADLERNRLLPALRLFAEVGNDFGGQGLGGSTRDGVETIVGFSVSMPLQNRAARGGLASAEAAITALEWKRRQSEEQILAEIAQLTNNLSAAERLTELARGEAAQADRLAAGERRLFEAGASDFFLVNLREEAAANAAISSIDAQFRLATAQTDLITAYGDLEALKLEDALGGFGEP